MNVHLQESMYPPYLLMASGINGSKICPTEAVDYSSVTKKTFGKIF